VVTVISSTHLSHSRESELRTATPKARSTARTYANSETRDKAIEEVATAQAERGDVQQARETAMSSADPRHTLESIAVVQASKGDLQGARETIVAISHSNRVLDAVAGTYPITNTGTAGRTADTTMHHVTVQ
jgi:hypothetical protein